MYSTAFWCLFVVLVFFWLYCVTAVTPFIERSKEYFPRNVSLGRLCYALKIKYPVIRGYQFLLDVQVFACCYMKGLARLPNHCYTSIA